jgi:nucleoside-diphosphate-sugar epimerase
MTKKQKVLLVGGAGYIGDSLVDYLLQRNYEVLVYDNLLYHDYYLKDVSFINGDIRDTDKVLEASKDCDVVVLLAAIVGDSAGQINLKATEEINFEAVKNICQKLPKDKFVIFFSSASVYGFNKDLVDETGSTNPLSLYADTKIRAEKYVIDRGGLVFRLGTIYGVSGKFVRIRADLVVNTLTINAYKDNKITLNSNNQKRPILSVKNISGYVEEACRRRQQGIFNLGYKNVKILDLGDEIKKVFPNVQIQFTSKMFEDNRSYEIDFSKSKKYFDYIPTITVEQEIRELYNLLKEKRIKNPNNILYNNGLYLANQNYK